MNASVGANLMVAAAGIAFVLLVALLAFMARPKFGEDPRGQQILATDVTARARIVDLIDTGNRYNDMPEVAVHLEVLPANRPPYPAVVRRVISVADIDLFARGRMLTVKYDPAHPDRVAIVDPGP